MAGSNKVLISSGPKKLANAPRGSGHDNFLHGILLGFDLTLSNKAWVEWERYHFQDIVSSNWGV